LRVVTKRGAGCDGPLLASGESSPDETLSKRTVKSCGPGAATLASIPACLCGPGNGGKTGRSPGRARSKPSNHCAGKVGMSWLYLSNPCASSYYPIAHGACGCRRHPAFPAPSAQEGQRIAKLRRKSRRENETACLSPSLRAKRSNPALPQQGKLDCFVACAPRNDDLVSRTRCRTSGGISGAQKTSPLLTLLWHCGHWAFSSRTAGRGWPGNEPSTVLAEDSAPSGFGHADSRRKLRDFGWGGSGRPRPRDPGCVPADPASWRASASYRPLRAVWAVCAWALRGSREIEKTLQRPAGGARPKKELQT
jgi:hypothetical protein